MQYKQRSGKKPSSQQGLTPGQDVFSQQDQAARTSFPTVGMTLPSYGSAGKTGGRNRAQPAIDHKSGFWKRLKARLSLKRVILSLVILLVLLGGYLGFKFIYNAHKLFGGNIFSIFSTTKLRGEDSGRVNILLAGNSADDPGHAGANLTDSIMLLSIDTKQNKAFMLSIPRDLYVTIPTAGYQKINDAYVVGENNNFSESGYFGGGMGQLQQVVEQDFGLPIDYYALIDYNAFKDAVNAVGGITITIQSNDPRGLYDPNISPADKGPLKLPNGQVTLNGQTALNLARARGDAYGSYGFPGSDFDRTQHQRQMLLALKSKAVSAGVISNPARLSSLSDAIGNNVKTDFSLSEIHRLYDLTKNINGNNIASVGLNNVNGKDLLTNYQARDGESALIPAAGLNDYSQIQHYIKQITSSDPVVQENASVVLLNASGGNGLASREKSSLQAKNFNVTAIGDALAAQSGTTIIDNSKGKKPATKQRLQQLFGNTVTTANPYSADYTADFIVLLGSSQNAPQTSQ